MRGNESWIGRIIYEPVVEVYFHDHDRPDDCQYDRATGLEATLHLQSIGDSLPLEEIYHLVEFPPLKSEEEE